jgi:hypothetical protein
MSQNRKSHGDGKGAAVLVGWGTPLWLAFWIAPYLYALNDLMQWR